MRGCLKFGCAGCATMVLLPLVAILVLVAISAVLGPGESTPGSFERSHEVVTRPEAAAGSRDFDAPLRLETGVDAPVGTILLDISIAEFRLVPGAAGEPLRVDARYDTSGYGLEERMVQDEDGSWVYELSFARKASWLRGIFQEDADNNVVTLTVPPDVPFRLRGKIGIGESELQLGGLWPVEVELEFGVGPHRIGFREATREPVERVALRGTIGGLRVEDLGNASPSRVEVRHRVGEVGIDLGGTWLRDADVDVRCGIGDCAVGLPDTARVELQRASVGFGDERRLADGHDEELPDDAPTLRLSVSGSIGEVRLER